MGKCSYLKKFDRSTLRRRFVNAVLTFEVTTLLQASIYK
jgi:hypothetical protein